MCKRNLLAMMVFLLLLTNGCAMPLPGKAVQVSNADRVEKSTGYSGDTSTSVPPESYYLPSPAFIEVDPTVFCVVVQDYLRLTEKEFSQQYPAKELWQIGVYDRLLFTAAAKGTIIGSIAIGDSLEEIERCFGKSQFSTEAEYIEGVSDYRRFLLYGYKTKNCYFVFQIASDTKTVQSVCLRKRHPLPKNRHDILVKLAWEYENWYGKQAEYIDEWNEYSDKALTAYTQWGRGTLSVISEYGFVSTSGTGDWYGVYADFEGSIPKLPARPNDYSEGEYEPITLFKIDYPQQMIYNIYEYLVERELAAEEKTEVISPDGNISAVSKDRNLLDMCRSSYLYENSHIVLHWKDGSQPDRQVYMGHFSTFVDFLNDRYLFVSNQLGLHVYDIEKDKLVYEEFDIREEDCMGIAIDFERFAIVDKNNIVRYRYRFVENGDLQITKSAEEGSFS